MYELIIQFLVAISIVALAIVFVGFLCAVFGGWRPSISKENEQ